MDNNCDSIAIHVGRNWLNLIPFLPSEKIRLIDATINGHICLTTFRLIFYVKHQTHTISLPYHLIRRVDASLGHLNITTKIGTTFICSFSNVLTAEKWNEKINAIMEYPINLSNLFAFCFRKALKEFDSNHPFLKPLMSYLELNNNDTTLEAAIVLHEFRRMEFSNQWKVTDVNNDFRICSSYPKYHIMPRDISDADIPLMAEFRSHKRFPSVVWRSKKTGAILLRCAQPCVGLMYYRNELDEQFVRAVLSNCREDPKSKHRGEDPSGLLIVDARNWRTAQLNRFRGGGFEYVEYYDQSQIRFMNLPNLHYVRDSFERLVKLYDKPDYNWYSTLETTKWLDYIGQLLKSASEVAAALDSQGRPVMVHCTDGWDRTPQLTSLAQILLDPYYRTMQGFRILVEREWLQFGHKFADRCGHGEETSPIFLQWLDCVRQVHRQFPSYFEFNELFLIKLAMHTYSGLFGTFLCNSERERQVNHSSTETCSVWAFLNPKHNWSICNYLYEPKSEVIKPAYHVKNLDLWDSLYQNALLPCTIVNTTAGCTVECENRVVEQLEEYSQSLPFSSLVKSHSPVNPLEVTTSTIVTSSGPPTHVGFCDEENIRNQQFTENSLLGGDIPRSQSLSTLSMNNYTLEGQMAITKTSVEAHFAVLAPPSTTNKPSQKPIIRSSSLSAHRNRNADDNGDEIDKNRQKLSRSHTSLIFEQQDQIPDKLDVNLPGDINEIETHTNLRAFHSDREISSSKKTEHIRCVSDPSSAHSRLRISSLFGDDMLLVDNQDEGMDSAHNPENVYDDLECGVAADDDDVLSTDIANAETPHWSSEEVGGEREYSPTGTTVASTNFSLPNDSFVLPNDNKDLDNDLDVLFSSQNHQLKPIFSTMSSSSSADGLGPWGQHYFVDPTFSSSFTSLNKEENSLSIRVSDKREVEKEEEQTGRHGVAIPRACSIAGTVLSHNHCHYVHNRSSDVVPPALFHHKNQTIIRSKTITGAAVDVDNAENRLQLRHSTSLRFSSPPENLDQFLCEGSSRDAKPLCPMWPSDWDGLPMRVDPVTWRLHHKLQEETRAQIDLQTQIDVLNSQQQSSQTMIQVLLEEVTRLRLLSELSSLPSIAPTVLRNGNHSSSSSSNNSPASHIPNNLQNVATVNGDRPPTIAEALSEAMNQPSTDNAVGDYLEDRMTRLITDSELLKVMDEDSSLHPTYALPVHLSSRVLRTKERDAVRSLSFCSDVSSFEVVDAKEALDVNGAHICGNCSLEFNFNRTAKPCRSCNLLFCGPCFDLVPRLHNEKDISQLQFLCDLCYHKLSAEQQLPQVVKFDLEPSVTATHVPQVGHLSNEQLFNDGYLYAPLGVHSRYTIPPSKSSTPSESPVNTNKMLNSSRCRSGRTDHTTPSSNRHSQNGVARA